MRRSFNKDLCVTSWSPEQNKETKKKTRKKGKKGFWFAIWFTQYLKAPYLEKYTPEYIKFETLAKMSGLNSGTLENWRYSKHRPNMERVLMLISALGRLSGEAEAYILADLYRCWSMYSDQDQF